MFVSTKGNANDLNTWLAYVTAHEITHMLMPGFAGDDKNLDPSNPSDSDSDKQLLMYPHFNEPHSQGYTADFIRFSDKSRSEIDLTSKQSVER